MAISIKQINAASGQTWDNIWRDCDYATYFHSREWAEIWKRYTKGTITPDPVCVNFSDHKTALIPFSRCKRLNGLLTKYLSSPAGTFGGWISTDALTPDHITALAGYILEKKFLLWRINPYDRSLSALNLRKTTADETQAIDLNAGFDAIVKKWSKGHKAAVTQARRYGVTVEKANKPQDWEAYFHIYRKSLKRWGEKSGYHWHLFQHMMEINSPHISLFLAKYQEKYIAGALCLYAKTHVVYWHGAALSETFHLRPVNLIIAEAIHEACDNGFSWFDFNPSGGHQGVKNFKKGFGTTSFPCNIVEKRPALLNILKPIKDIYETIGRFI